MVPAVEIAAPAGLAHDRQAAPGWLARADRSMPDVDADAPRLTEFDRSGGEGGRWAARGRFDVVSTSGGSGPAADGRVAAGHAGLEVRSDGLLAGVALSRADATLEFSGRTDGLEAHVTSVTPCLHGEFDGGASLWGQVAFGRGDLRAMRPGGGASEAGLNDDAGRPFVNDLRHILAALQGTFAAMSSGRRTLAAAGQISGVTGVDCSCFAGAEARQFGCMSTEP